MANSVTKTLNNIDSDIHQIVAVIDTAEAILDVGSGPGTLRGIICNVASGSDFLLIWDNLNPVLSTDAPDFQLPTSTITTLIPGTSQGLYFANGLSFAVTNTGGTAGANNPSNANTITFIWEPD